MQTTNCPEVAPCMPAFRLATRKPDLHVLHYWTGTQTGLSIFLACFYGIMRLNNCKSGLMGELTALPPAPTPTLNQFHLIVFPNPTNTTVKSALVVGHLSWLGSFC